MNGSGSTLVHAALGVGGAMSVTTIRAHSTFTQHDRPKPDAGANATATAGERMNY